MSILDDINEVRSELQLTLALIKKIRKAQQEDEDNTLIITRNVEGGIENTIFCDKRSQDFNLVESLPEYQERAAKVQELETKMKAKIDHHKGNPSIARRVAHLIRLGRREVFNRISPSESFQQSFADVLNSK